MSHKTREDSPSSFITGPKFAMRVNFCAVSTEKLELEPQSCLIW